MMFPADRPIFLIGYRGSGKSAVAPELASRIGYDWIDTDDEIERRAGKTIAAIFAQGGEAAFRDMELRVVAELANSRRTVIALGGGAVLREENRAAICGAGPVVWLTATVDTILQRIATDAATSERRPNLTAAGGRAEVVAILAARTPLYRECATLAVDTEGKLIPCIVDEIVAQL